MPVSRRGSVSPEEAYRQLMQADSRGNVDREGLVGIMIRAANPVWAYEVLVYNEGEFYHSRISYEVQKKLFDVIAEGRDAESAFRAIPMAAGYRHTELAQAIADNNAPQWAYEALKASASPTFTADLRAYRGIYLDTVISHGTPRMVALILWNHRLLGRDLSKAQVDKAVDRIIRSDQEDLAGRVCGQLICRPPYYPVYRSLRRLVDHFSIRAGIGRLRQPGWEEHRSDLREEPKEFLVTTRARLRKLGSLQGPRRYDDRTLLKEWQEWREWR